MKLTLFDQTLREDILYDNTLYNIVEVGHASMHTINVCYKSKLCKQKFEQLTHIESFISTFIVLSQFEKTIVVFFNYNDLWLVNEEIGE